VIAQFRSREFAAFLLTGGIAALMNFGSRIVLNRWLTFSTAVVVAYLIGMITAFVLARLFVFSDARQSIPRSALRFALVNAVAVLQTWGISMLLAYYMLPAAGVDRYVNEIAHAIGVVVPVFTSFLGHKHWSFR
jgi:putative flippase GtrA